MGAPVQKSRLLLGLVLGLALGLWWGVNLGKGRAIFSNPFAQDSLESRLKETGTRVLEKSGQALEEGGKALRKAAH